MYGERDITECLREMKDLLTTITPSSCVNISKICLSLVSEMSVHANRMATAGYNYKDFLEIQDMTLKAKEELKKLKKELPAEVNKTLEDQYSGMYWD